MSDLERLRQLTIEANQTGNAALVPELRRLAERTAGEPDGAATRGGAYLLAYKLGFDPTDLDFAVDELRRAAESDPTGAARGNLAAGLLERADLSGSAGDFREALGLLRDTLADADISPATRLLRRTTLLSATLDGVERELLDVSARQLIADGEQLLADATSANVDSSEIANVVASAYFLLSNQEDLAAAEQQRMVELAGISAAALPSDHPDLPARLANLATMQLQVHRLVGDGQALVDAVATTQRAYDSLAANHPSRLLLINNMCNVAVAAYEASGGPELIGDLIDEALGLPDSFEVDHPLRPIALSNVGLFTRIAASALNRSELIDVSVAAQREALGHTPEDGYRRAGREASLALVLSDRYHRDRDAGDLTEAIQLSERALERTRRGHQIDVVGFETNLANMYHDRFTLIGDFGDLQRARDLHQSGIAAIPVAHPDRASLLNNAGGCFHAMYLRLADIEDLAASIRLLRESVEITAESSPMLAARRINYAGALDSAAARSDQAAELLDEAERQIRAALASELTPGERETATGILVAVLKSRFTLLGDHASLQEMAEVDPPSLPSKRAVTSLRRGVTAGLLGDHETEERQLRAALEQGADHHPAAALGAASLLADHALRQVAAGHDESLTWLDQAAAVAVSVRNQVGSLAQTPDVELSWYNDLDGVGEAQAHGRLLCGDTSGAVEAIESTRGWFLGRRIPESSNVLACPIVYIWTTQVGTGIVVGDGPHSVGTTIADVDVSVLRRLATDIRSCARDGREPMSEVDAAVAYLTSHLGEPLSDLLGRYQSAAISVAGPLASLPITAIEVDGETLADRWDLRFGPTRSSLAWATGQASTRRVDVSSIVSFAEPEPSRGRPLQAARSESLYVAGKEGSRLGGAATGAGFIDALRSADVVHAALHAVASPRNPLSTAMYFADGALHVESVLQNAPYRARLVILSACETASRSEIATDQLLGLANTIHASGVPAVLGSLWSVGDLHSAAFVCDFVDRVRAGGSPSQAFREAQRELRRQSAPASQWAAFELLGA